MRSAALFVAGLALVAGAGRLSAQGADPVPAMQRQLAREAHGGVFDFGRLLKPGAVRELQALARDFEGGGLRLWVVTVPADVQVHVAERLYASLSMTENDLLIVFNGRQAYGRTDALKGDPQAFKDALQQSRGDFSVYWGKGLGTFATILRARIEERRGMQSSSPTAFAGQPGSPALPANREPPGLTWGVGAAAVALVVLAWIPLHRRQLEARAKAQYEEHLATARQLFTRYGERVVENASKEEDARFVDFSKRLEACEKEKNYLNLGGLARLIADLEAELKG